MACPWGLVQPFTVVLLCLVVLVVACGGWFHAFVGAAGAKSDAWLIEASFASLVQSKLKKEKTHHG